MADSCDPPQQCLANCQPSSWTETLLLTKYPHCHHEHTSTTKTPHPSPWWSPLPTCVPLYSLHIILLHVCAPSKAWIINCPQLRGRIFRKITVVVDSGINESVCGREDGLCPSSPVITSPQLFPAMWTQTCWGGASSARSHEGPSPSEPGVCHSPSPGKLPALQSGSPWSVARLWIAWLHGCSSFAVPSICHLFDRLGQTPVSVPNQIRKHQVGVGGGGISNKHKQTPGPC